MRSPKRGSVYKYFDLADRFLRINRLDPRGAVLNIEPGLNRSGYRRALIEACIDELAEGIARQLEELYPDDPLAAEDLLYQLCISVNPELDIHRVCLREGPPVEAEVEASEVPEAERGVFLEELRLKTRGLRRRLRARVFGQDAAVESVTAAVRRAAAGLAEPQRPLGALLFTGRTGTGKTELARSLSAELFEAGGLVRVDCSEYALAHEAARLTGAPPGYVGHEDGGQLTEALRRNPACIVLFDEIEKAHPRMHQMLLQVLDEGRLTDSKGRTVSFDRALVVMTSNAGAREVAGAADPLGFAASPEPRRLDRSTLAGITQNALGQVFPPEFLGRIDQTVVFRDLGVEDARAIARRMLGELAQRVRDAGDRVAFTPAVARWTAERGFDPHSGARGLRRVLRSEIEAPLADALLEPRGEDGDEPRWIRVSVQRGELRLARESAA